MDNVSPAKAVTPRRVGVLILPGAAGEAPALAAIHREAFEVERLEPPVLEGQADGPDPSVVLVWVPRGIPEGILESVTAWRDRSPKTTALIGCSPDGTVADSEHALAAGFDDFMIGRCSPREIVARLGALLRRLQSRRQAADGRLSFGGLVLDRTRNELRVGKARVLLTPLEFGFMEALFSARGAALERVKLLDLVWGVDELEVGLRAVDNLVLRLRRKIGAPNLILTVRGVGFRLSEH